MSQLKLFNRSRALAIQSGLSVCFLIHSGEPGNNLKFLNRHPLGPSISRRRAMHVLSWQEVDYPPHKMRAKVQPTQAYPSRVPLRRMREIHTGIDIKSDPALNEVGAQLGGYNISKLSLLAALLVLGPISNVPVLREFVQVCSAADHDPVLHWNAIALDAVVADHSASFGPPEQGGPTRSSRALAIVHIAIFDAVNSIDGRYEPYIRVTGLPPRTFNKASIDAAVAAAACRTLVALYPNQREVFDDALRDVLKSIPEQRGRSEGVAVGRKAAENILTGRRDDSEFSSDLPFPPDAPKSIGAHRPDPLNPNQGLLTPMWGLLTPFAMNDLADFNAPPPPRPDSHLLGDCLAYAVAYDEVKRLGGDGIVTPTERTPEQTEIGLFWAYDGSIGIGVPPRLYNQIARVIAEQERNNVAENARLFALINIAQADAGICCWYGKYFYNYWRPVIGIRCGGADDNELTDGDSTWTPLGAPASNQSNGGVNFTPAFPSYTSGHATFGASMFRTLARLYGDAYKFDFVSDELNGRTTDADGNPRPRVKRRFRSFSQAARENADSRIYLGIHWRFDADEGIAAGNAIADHVVDNFLRPVR